MLEHNDTVELLGYYGSDEIIACSAWTSTSRNLTEDKKQRIPELIKYLWKNSHESPFEKGVLHFLVNTNIATHIQITKHRIGVSFNSESARYKELKEDKFYLPEDWGDIRVSDELHSVFADTWIDALKNYTELGNDLYHKCLKDLEPVLGRKRAKESARFFKTYNSQIQGDLMFNMRSFANFIRLRSSEHAQVEIRQIAKKMIELVENIPGKPFEHTLSAWRECKIYE